MSSEQDVPRLAPIAEGWFGPTPSQLAGTVETTRARFGENSLEHAEVLLQLGDAHMRQGLLANPEAQTSYEKALEICLSAGEETAETAWVYDRLACVKQSSGDSFGAEADLAKALHYWTNHPPNNRLADAILDNYVARRTEDWEGLRKLNEFLQRQPPEL